MNEQIMRMSGFEKEMNLVKEGKCPTCGCVINTDSFRDGLSKREYKISGMCQTCQDKTFG
jgi:hypothetical protein